MPYNDDSTVKDAVGLLSGVVGEKMGVKRCDILTTGGTVADYTHMNGRIGVLAAVDKVNAWDLAYDIAMQVAASNPKYIYPEDVPTEELEKEKEIYREQLLKEGKPENIIDKIMEGKINKFYEEVCLVKQEYIKDDKKKVEEILNGAKVEKIIRYSL
jgi:elongation factor Ts